MSEKPLSLWVAYPEDLQSESMTQASVVLLSEEERERLQSLRFERRRREYLANRMLTRTALSQFYPLAPKEWRFKVNAYGKPAADPECGLRFNLSDSHALAVCLVADGVEVGVDVEPYERGREIVEIAAEVFSAREMEQLEALQGNGRLDRALQLWTLKEAYIKARGMGLSLPLKKFSFVFGGAEGIRLQLDADFEEEAGRNWRFCLLDFAGHRVALMTERETAGALQMWEARGLPAPPVRLPDAVVQWFGAA
jgi:4'-phosphopantetheinyl transferase